jgi:PHD/YefM family antitoxin component YafN of YafNO toxin-antitoxin module
MCAMAAKYMVDAKGKKTAVILPIDEYEQLMEDLHDLIVVAERRDEESISYDEMMRRLKKNGKL